MVRPAALLPASTAPLTPPMAAPAAAPLITAPAIFRALVIMPVEERFRAVFRFPARLPLGFAAFLAEDFLAAGFLAADFFAADFLADGLAADRFRLDAAFLPAFFTAMQSPLMRVFVTTGSVDRRLQQ